MGVVGVGVVGVGVGVVGVGVVGVGVGVVGVGVVGVGVGVVGVVGVGVGVVGVGVGVFGVRSRSSTGAVVVDGLLFSMSENSWFFRQRLTSCYEIWYM